ncbi:MAG: hypothetical protein AAB431_03940 [Patescibacteria group bacterium]
MDMMRMLDDAERFLPHLLRSQEGWNSLDVDYHAPRVERLWRPMGENRLSLHVIHPCRQEDALLHPHKVPSAMRIFEGIYRMSVGSSPGIETPPIVFSSVVHAGQGTIYRYSMEHPDGWHSVTPIGQPVWTVMVSGKPWDRPIPEVTEAATGKLNPLPDWRVDQILSGFRGFIRY